MREGERESKTLNFFFGRYSIHLGGSNLDDMV